MEEYEKSEKKKDVKGFHFQMQSKCKPSPVMRGVKSIVFGLTVIAAGVLLLMKNAGMLDPEAANVIFSWQMLLVAIGFINLWGREFVFGLILMAVGGYFIGTDFVGMDLSIASFIWPAIIILIGLIIMFKSRLFSFEKRFQKGVENYNESFEEVNVLGGSEKVIHAENFKFAKITAVMGGSSLDLSNVIMSEDGAIIDMTCVLGGTSIIVPSDWDVRFEGVAILGGISDERKVTQVDYSKKLTIKGICVMGGCEIKNS
jgi:predicted membrane protein